MSNRIEEKFKALKKINQKALLCFIMAGDPNLKTTPEIVWTLETAGMDILELGMPFTDPAADGPVIQLSGQRALKSGTNLTGILDTVEKIRVRSQVPILLMGYFNPIFRYGIKAFFSEAKKAGVDGMLIVDLPPEEAQEAQIEAKRQGLALVFLLDPTSDLARIRKIDHCGSGFHYYVSMTGITGAKLKEALSSQKAFKDLKKISSLPVCVGFGVKTPEQAVEIAELGDGVVVGSAIVDLFKEYKKDITLNKVKVLVSKISKGIKNIK